VGKMCRVEVLIHILEFGFVVRSASRQYARTIYIYIRH
jgi:hypothetical protein